MKACDRNGEFQTEGNGRNGVCMRSDDERRTFMCNSSCWRTATHRRLRGFTGGRFLQERTVDVESKEHSGHRKLKEMKYEVRRSILQCFPWNSRVDVDGRVQKGDSDGTTHSQRQPNQDALYTEGKTEH